MVSDARFYASRTEDDGWCPMQSDNARDAAIEYANEWALEADTDDVLDTFGDLVHVIHATEAATLPDGWGDPEEEGWPLDTHARWCFRLVAEVPGGFEVEEVPDAR